jgi:hypothetical protein
MDGNQKKTKAAGEKTDSCLNPATARDLKH